MRLSIVYRALILFMTVSCTYTLEQEFINPIKPPEPIEVIVQITDPDFQDPYYLDFPTEFVVNFQISKPVIEWLVTVNGKSIISSYANQALRFNLIPQSLGAGTHRVTMKLSVKTLSGSLAEQLGAEYYLIEREFEVNVVPQIPDPVSPLSASLVEGYLNLQWNLGASRHYRYRLKINQLVGNVWQPLEEKEFLAFSQSHLIDSGYVGGLVRYELVAFNSFTSRSVGTTQVQIPLVTFTGFKDNSNFATLSCDAISNKANLLLVSASGSQQLPINSSEYRLDSLVMGETRNYRLVLYRNNYQNRSYDTTLTIPYSNPNLRAFQNLKIVSGTSQLYLQSPFYLDRYNLNTFQQEAEWNNPYGFEPQLIGTNAMGNYLIVGNTLVQPSTLLVLKGVLPYFGIPPADNAFVTVTNFSDPTSNGLQGVNFISDGIPCAAVRNFNKQSYELVEWYEPFNTDVPILSDDGQYMSLNEKDKSACKIFKRQGESWILIGRVPAKSRHFRGPESAELIVIGTSVVEVYDLSDLPDVNGNFPMKRNFQLTAAQQAGITGYDPISQKIYVQTMEGNYSTIQTYNISDFGSQEQVRAYIQITTPFPTKHIFAGDFHFLSSGFGEPIKP